MALTKGEAVERLLGLMARIDQLEQVDVTKLGANFAMYEVPGFHSWQDDTQWAISDIFGSQSTTDWQQEFIRVEFKPGAETNTRSGEYQKAYLYGLRQSRECLKRMIEEVRESGGETILNEQRVKGEKVEILERAASGSCVFVGHGRSPLWARVQLFLEKDLGLEVITYESESRVGESIVPVLEEMLNRAEFAVLVLTAEDETAAGVRRARQNVIHEAGLFQGKLGFRRAILLKQDEVEDFSNVAGLQHISFTGERIEQAFWELQRVLKKQGLIR